MLSPRYIYIYNFDLFSIFLRAEYTISTESFNFFLGHKHTQTEVLTMARSGHQVRLIQMIPTYLLLTISQKAEFMPGVFFLVITIMSALAPEYLLNTIRGGKKIQEKQ